MLTFYYSPGSAALSSHIALEEIGAPYEAIRLNFAEGEQTKAPYLAVNPKGRVPALVTEDGTLTEAQAVLHYLAIRYPDVQLLPRDPFRIGRVHEVLGYLSSTAHVNHAHGRRGYRWSDDAAAVETMVAKVPETMTESARILEETYLEGPYVLGETYSIADMHLFTVCRWLEWDEVDVSPFPKILAHRATMRERPAVQRALAAQGLE